MRSNTLEWQYTYLYVHRQSSEKQKTRSNVTSVSRTSLSILGWASHINSEWRFNLLG